MHKNSEETRRKISESLRILYSDKTNHPNYGRHLPDTHRRRMSESHKGKHFSEDHKRRLSESHINKQHTNETKIKIGESNKGKHYKPHSKEARKKISEKNKIRFIDKKNHPMYGKHHSQETRYKISKSKMGKLLSDEHKRRIGESSKGKKHSEYTKRKMREIRLLRVIPNKDTSIEIKLQNILKSNSIEFRTHEPIFGQPDIFIEPDICLFADGNYWHKKPGAQERDELVNKMLIKQGYRVIRFWEDDIDNNIGRCYDIIVGVVGTKCYSTAVDGGITRSP